MKINYLLILALSWFNSFAQRNSTIVFEEKRADLIANKIDSILLIGVGSTTTRIFLDDLSQVITTRFNDAGIVTHYYYLGRDPRQVKLAYDTINKAGFKAILFFLPNQPSIYEVKGTFSRIHSPPNILAILGPIEVKVPSSKIHYQQDFDFELYLPEPDLTRIWSASVEISGDLRKSRNAKSIGNKLLLCFRKNKYLKQAGHY